MRPLVTLVSLLQASLSAWATLSPRATTPCSSPTVHLDSATVYGVSDGYTNAFYGLRYAQAPIGDLRFNVPAPNVPYNGSINATAFGNLCYNFNAAASLPTWLTTDQHNYLERFNIPPPAPYDEDCLNLNVITPTNIRPGVKLPVVAYIFYGAFDFGGSYDVDGRIMVKQSIDNGEPLIFVSMNHRQTWAQVFVQLSEHSPTNLDCVALGFLPGKEIKDAQLGNLGLQDQRQALRWIQKYIHHFEGDPQKVTLLGLSSGGVSAALHTVYNNGSNDGLFRALWAESGAVQPLGWIDAPQPQAMYDAYAASLNCSAAADSLACIREAPLEAVTNISAVTGVWSPHVDGVTIPDLPQKMISEGTYAHVSAVAGNAEDEGTLFAMNEPDLTSDQEFIMVAKLAYYSNLSDADSQRLVELYPNDAAQGAPYETGDSFQYTKMHKRLASFDGDAGVDSVRRFFTRQLSTQGDVWAYYYRRFYIDGFGSTHASEVPDMYESGNMADLFIHFVNTLDPNGAPGITQEWPKYDNANPVLLEFSENTTLGLMNDTYREDAIDFLIQLNLATPWPL